MCYKNKLQFVLFLFQKYFIWIEIHMVDFHFNIYIVF